MHGHFALSKPKLNPTNLEILDSPLIGKVLKTPKKTSNQAAMFIDWKYGERTRQVGKKI